VSTRNWTYLKESKKITLEYSTAQNVGRQEEVKAKAVPLYTTKALGGTGGIARTHFRPRH
jgi:hypothetical protein